jgi:hypothetical protein
MEDESKVKASMWNDFNCEGKVWCQVSDSDKEIMATKKVSKIRIQNGRTFESYTHVISDEADKSYFIQLFLAVKNQTIKTSK